MSYYTGELTKEDMLAEMEEHNWDHELTERSSYSEVYEEWKMMQDEFEAAEDAMFPNGRDYVAEDFD